MGRLRVAIVGVGGIAGAHLPGWRASPDAELVAGCDVDGEVLRRWGEQHGVTRLYERVEELLAAPDIDIVDVCTPNQSHAPLAIAALEAGKHVLCEKPLAPRPGQVREMIEARDRSGRLLMTAQSLRFEPRSRALHLELTRGVLGHVYHARCWSLRRGGVPVRPGFVRRELSGGGPCIDIGVHVLDLALWLMGNPVPVSVSGVARADLSGQEGAFSAWGGAPIPPEYDVEDFAAGFVRFDDGATLILETSWLLHGEDRSEVWLYGTGGGCHWPSLTVLEDDKATRQRGERKLLAVDTSVGGHALECIEFARAVAGGGPSPVPPEQSLQVMAILDGIYRSQELGGEVLLG